MSFPSLEALLEHSCGRVSASFLLVVLGLFVLHVSFALVRLLVGWCSIVACWVADALQLSLFLDGCFVVIYSRGCFYCRYHVGLSPKVDALQLRV